MVYIWKNIRRSVWPGVCLLCGGRPEPGRDLCTGCAASLPRNRNPCAACAYPLGIQTPVGALCGPCQRRPPSFSGALVPYLYAQSVTFLVAELKFRQRLSAGRILGDLLADAAAQAARPRILVPVPLHPHRLAERGFNQAGELALRVGRRLSIPVLAGGLQRLRHTPAQRALGRKGRLRNLQQAFRWRGDGDLGHVAVIDDVITTGATAEAVARVLRAGGAGRIDIWAVARTPWRGTAAP